MKNDEPRDPLFAPFREAQAPPRFCANVMDRIRHETECARGGGFVVAGKKGLRWVLDLFKNSRARWVWAAVPAAACAAYFLLPRPSVPVSITGTDVSFYLADSASVEDEAVLGTDIETIFL
ncbi:MAG: hypothetical protein IPN19_11455 [Elusimicrobia bacterium]|nr:hypothetical protein [Elusimicrobiota bacterium]